MTVDLCTVSGTLVAPDGSPMPAVEVRFLPAPVGLRSQGSATQAPQPVAAVTDAAADLSVGLAPGVYTLRAREPMGREYPPCLIDVPVAETADLAEILLHLPAPQSVYDAAASARAASSAAGTAIEAAGLIDTHAADVLATGLRTFPGLAAARSATVPTGLSQIAVMEAGRVLVYRRDPFGTALVTGDGATWSPADRPHVGHWGGGPVADAAENATALGAAQAAGATVIVSGTLALGDNVPLRCLEGDGSAEVLRPVIGASGTRYLFRPQDGARMEDISVGLTEDPASGATFLARYNTSDMALHGVVADGGVEIVEGIRNWNGSVLHVTGGHDVTGMAISDSTFRRFAYVFLKANATVSTERNIRITNCTFDDFTSPALLFNSPAAGSLVEDIAIIGNRVGANHAENGFWHRGSFAGNVIGGRVAFNYFHGVGGEIFRMEEGAEGHVFTGNVGYLEGEHGFETVANQAGGEGFKIPRRTILSDNVLVGEPGATGRAFHFVHNANGAGIKESIAHDNIAAGEWEYGFYTTREAGTTLVHHNAAMGTAGGLQMSEPSLSIRDTLMVDVAQPMSVAKGGLIGPIHLRAPDGAFPPVPSQMVLKDGAGVGPGPAGVTGWTWEARGFTLPSGNSQLFRLMPLGYMMRGRLTLAYHRNANAHRTTTGMISWDGTTLIWAQELTRGVGTVVFTGSGTAAVVNDDGNLSIQLNNVGGALTGSAIYAAFEGVHAW